MIEHPLPTLPTRGRVTSRVWQDNARAEGSPSPLWGGLGRGCVVLDVSSDPPPPLIPPHKGEGVDWNTVPKRISILLGMVAYV